MPCGRSPVSSVCKLKENPNPTMPKKKKKDKKEGKKKGKGGGEAKETAEDDKKPFEAPGASDKEVLLKKE